MRQLIKTIQYKYTGTNRLVSDERRAEQNRGAVLLRTGAIGAVLLSRTKHGGGTAQSRKTYLFAELQHSNTTTVDLGVCVRDCACVRTGNE